MTIIDFLREVVWICLQIGIGLKMTGAFLWNYCLIPFLRLVIKPCGRWFRSDLWRAVALICALSAVWGVTHQNIIYRIQKDAVSHIIYQTKTIIVHASEPSRAPHSPSKRLHLCHVPTEQLPPPGPCGDRWRQAEQPNPEHVLAVPPSVSERAIRNALWAVWGSAADGPRSIDGKTIAEYVWDEGKIKGIDPAVVIGIWHHESTFSQFGMARITHSIGNIRPVGLQPEVCSNDGCYRYYNDIFQAIDDTYRLLHDYVYQYHRYDVTEAIKMWAPPNDGNNDTLYIGDVIHTMDSLHDKG